MTHLVDTSAWIEVLRADRRTDVKERVSLLIADGEARWCEMILVELWNGARTRDAQRIDRLRTLVPTLQIDAEVWDMAIRPTKAARAKAITVQATDLLIAACARRHGAAVYSYDRHFDYLAGL